MSLDSDRIATLALANNVADERLLSTGNQPTNGDSNTTIGPVSTQPDYSGTPLTEPLQIAAGRELPDLLFVTSKQALAANIGYAESTYLLDTLRNNALLYEDLPQGLPDSTAAI